LPLLGSNQDSPDPESGVLPITPRGRGWSYVIRRYVVCVLGPTLMPPRALQARAASRTTYRRSVLQRCSHGAEGARTPDLLGAIQALSQLSYSPARTLNLNHPQI